MEGSKDVVTNGRDVRPVLSRGSSLLYVLSVVAGNRDLRRVELAFAAFKCVENATWLAMLVYAYAQGGVTESGVVATLLLIPAAAFAPVVGVIGERFAQGTVLLAGYVAQAATCAAVAVALALDAHPLIVYALIVGPSVTFTITRPTQSTFAPALARSPEELTATNVVSGWVESLEHARSPCSDRSRTGPGIDDGGVCPRCSGLCRRSSSRVVLQGSGQAGDPGRRSRGE